MAHRLPAWFLRWVVNHDDELWSVLMGAREHQQYPMREQPWEDLMGADGWLNDLFTRLYHQRPYNTEANDAAGETR